MRRWIAPALIVAGLVLLLALSLAQPLQRASVARQARAALVQPLSALEVPAVYALGRAVDTADSERLRQVASRAAAAGDLRTAGIALAAAGDYPAAQRDLEEIHAQQPDDLFASLALGNVLDAQGENAAAQTLWQPIDAQQALAMQLHRTGSAIGNAGDRERASVLLEAAMAIDPANPNPPYTLAGYYWAEDQEHAVALYRVALAAGGLDPFFQHVAAGRVALADGSLEEAASDFESALAVRPDNGDILTTLATVLNRLGRPDEALQYLQRAVVLSEDPFRSLMEIGELQLEQGAYGEAIQSLREAITLRPDRHYAFALLAQAYSGDGQPAQAALAWQQASSLNPDNSFYIIQLGDALQASGDPEGAVEAYRRGLELNPESDYARRQLRALGVAP